MKSVIVGTAGHIDHGKTSLVKALTGIDADRLEEEKRRGITIDIGFAHLELPSLDGEVLRLGFVDVPGHERFVRNMLAGIGGIDLVVLVIAADEGIKPQTREHFDICKLLGLRRGMTVLTRSDAVDAETLEVVRLEVEEFLRGSFLDAARSPIIAASSLTRAGLDQVKAALVDVAAQSTVKNSTSPARLPVDRVFSMKGFGTVVTGTLVSGIIRKEEELDVFPTGKHVRVRGIEVHGAAAEKAIAGQRTALNITGVEIQDLARGVTLATKGIFQPVSRVYARISLLASAKPLKDGAPVHFHAYTMETTAEVRLLGTKSLKPGAESFAQIKFANPALIVPGDRFIVRQFSPVVTIGGGVVLDPVMTGRQKQRPDEREAFLKALLEGSPAAALVARVEKGGISGLTLDDAMAVMNMYLADAERLAEEVKLVRCGGALISPAAFAQASANLLEHLKEFHNANALVGGMNQQALRERLGAGQEVFEALIARATAGRKIEVAGELVRLPGRGVVMKDDEAESKEMIEKAFVSAGLKVPSLREVLAGLKVDKTRAQKIVTLLLRDRVLVKISDELIFHRNALADLRQEVTALKGTTPKIDVARFKDITGVSRKYAIPLLEYLDRERVTKRVGDERVIL